MNKLEQAARALLAKWDAHPYTPWREVGFISGDVANLREALAEPKCWCETCRPITMDDMRMVLCPTCGNKRCPHATDHRNACTGSNKPGQKGSSYEHCKPAEQAEQEPVAEVVLRNQSVGFGRTEERKDIQFLADVDVGTKLYAKSQQQAEQRSDSERMEPMNVDAINTSSEYVDEIENKRHEPVAWVNKERTQSIEWLKIAPEHGTKLYTAPVRTKDLTDNEIVEIMKQPFNQREYLEQFARAVIAADREKNK